MKREGYSQSKAVKRDFFSVAATLIAESRAKNAGYSLKSL